MNERIVRLLARAAIVAEGADANRVLWEVSTDADGVHPTGENYEAVVEVGGSFDEFLEKLLPKMTTHFLAKRYGLFGGPGVHICLWCNERIHVFACAAFFDIICEIEEMSHDDLRARILHLRRDAGF